MSMSTIAERPRAVRRAKAPVYRGTEVEAPGYKGSKRSASDERRTARGRN